MPAKFPNMFCQPVHLPEAAGPASVCVIAQRFEERNPKDRQVPINRTMQTAGSFTMAAGRIIVLPSRPPTAHVLRTCVGVPPRAIQRSDNQPPMVEESAMAQNGSEPTMAMVLVEKWRSITRYDGSHVSRKYHA